jgi:hypothetical protein
MWGQPAEISLHFSCWCLHPEKHRKHGQNQRFTLNKGKKRDLLDLIV